MSKLSGTLGEKWREFEQATIPDDFGPHARKMIQCAFFAGAISQSELEKQIGPETTVAEARAYLEGLNREVQQFFEEQFGDAWEQFAERRRQQGGAVH